MLVTGQLGVAKHDMIVAIVLGVNRGKIDFCPASGWAASLHAACATASQKQCRLCCQTITHCFCEAVAHVVDEILY